MLVACSIVTSPDFRPAEFDLRIGESSRVRETRGFTTTDSPKLVDGRGGFWAVFQNISPACTALDTGGFDSIRAGRIESWRLRHQRSPCRRTLSLRWTPGNSSYGYLVEHGANPWSMLASPDLAIATWLILPVVICLSQRLSHACLCTNFDTVKPRMAH